MTAVMIVGPCIKMVFAQETLETQALPTHYFNRLQFLISGKIIKGLAKVILRRSINFIKIYD